MNDIALIPSLIPKKRRDDDSNMCRICWDEEGNMFQPCECKGSIGWVHGSCLLLQRTFTCSVCQSDFYIPPNQQTWKHGFWFIDFENILTEEVFQSIATRTAGEPRSLTKEESSSHSEILHPSRNHSFWICGMVGIVQTILLVLSFTTSFVFYYIHVGLASLMWIIFNVYLVIKMQWFSTQAVKMKDFWRRIVSFSLDESLNEKVKAMFFDEERHRLQLKLIFFHDEFQNLVMNIKRGKKSNPFLNTLLKYHSRIYMLLAVFYLVRIGYFIFFMKEYVGLVDILLFHFTTYIMFKRYSEEYTNWKFHCKKFKNDLKMIPTFEV
jgi:hypothetical protein